VEWEMHVAWDRFWISAGYLEHKQPLYDEPFKAQWLLYVPPALTLKNSALYAQSVYVCLSRDP
jgi:hypothetical protein